MHLQALAALAASVTVALAADAATSISGVPSPERVGFQHLRAADLKADLYFLASDALQGRMSLRPGDEAATQWVAAEFAKAGLEPAAGNSSYLQAVPLIEYRGDRDASFVALKRGDKITSWHAPDVLGGFQDQLRINPPLGVCGYRGPPPGVPVYDIHASGLSGLNVA